MGVDLHGAAWALGMTESNQARQAMASLFTPNWEKGARGPRSVGQCSPASPSALPALWVRENRHDHFTRKLWVQMSQPIWSSVEVTFDR